MGLKEFANNQNDTKILKSDNILFKGDKVTLFQYMYSGVVAQDESVQIPTGKKKWREQLVQTRCYSDDCPLASLGCHVKPSASCSDDAGQSRGFYTYNIQYDAVATHFS